VMAWTLRGSMVIPFWETIKPRRRTGVMSGQVSMRCSTIEGSMPGISVYDQANISRNSWKRDL
jgi:hypothetical protein